MRKFQFLLFVLKGSYIYYDIICMAVSLSNDYVVQIFFTQDVNLCGSRFNKYDRISDSLIWVEQIIQVETNNVLYHRKTNIYLNLLSIILHCN